MADPLALVQTAATVITAIAAAGAFRYVRRYVQTLREHERVLFGEEAVEGWDGIVPTVKANKERSKMNQQQVESLKRTIRDD